MHPRRTLSTGRHGIAHFLGLFARGLFRPILSQKGTIQKHGRALTMNDDNTTMPQFVLVDGLSLHQSLIEEGPQGGRLVETYDAII